MSSTKETVVPLYSIQEEHLQDDEILQDDWDFHTNLPINKTKRTCCFCLFQIVLKLATIILGLLTFIFAILVAPFAVWVGKAPSQTTLKHAIRQAGGSFITWGDRNQYVLEYFVMGSRDKNADVMLLYAGAFSPGSIWSSLSGDQSADVWGKMLGLKLICPTNPGLGCSSLPKGRVMSKVQVVEVGKKLLSKERVTGKFFVAGLSQGTHVAGIIADYLSPRIKGVLLMCPYMPILKNHELLCNGKKYVGTKYLDEDPRKIPVHVLKDLFPDNFILNNMLCQILPIVNHSFCLFKTWSGFTRRSFGVAPDMHAATQRCDAEGNSEWIDSFLQGQSRGTRFNMYGETSFLGHGNLAKMAGKDGITPVVVATDMNVNEIPDILCSARQSWWMTDNIPNARLITCDIGYGHLTEYLFCHELFHTAMPLLRKEDAIAADDDDNNNNNNNNNNENAIDVNAGINGSTATPSITGSIRSQRSGTSNRTRFRKRREDIWKLTDHTIIPPPHITKHSPIPWSIRRENGMYQTEFRKWVTTAYIARLHFGFIFLALLFGASYSYTSYVIWTGMNIPAVICITGAILLGPMLIVNLIVVAKYSDPSSPFRVVLNSSHVIQQSSMIDDDDGDTAAMNKNMQIRSHNANGCCLQWSFQGILIFVIWILSNSICIYYLNVNSFNQANIDNMNLGNDTGTSASISSSTIPILVQCWHILASILFAFILVHLISLMTTGLNAISTSSMEIVSRIRTWSPPIRTNSNERSGSTMTNSLTMIAADINLFDESIVGLFSLFFQTPIHSILLGTFLFIAAVCIALLENTEWIINEDTVTKTGIAVIGLLIGFGALAAKVLSTMAATTSICSCIPLSTSRLRLRVVELMDNEADERDVDATRWLQSVSESVRALCDSVIAHPMGFRLSGFVVSPKMVMQVMYGFVSLLFLVLAGGRGGMTT
jgi:hypothetical protein